ncbi:MAG: type I-F CRISPR-associated helicase Cas3f [Proteobacteria bacterium]|jgi:CRISPR-associated endonuclease/helicase Cas3|nr:type I-F CRISPR-associated helicase Cas3f [Pseudomonadota bacterium]
MMVTFVSQCEKLALKRTRRVLDAFANRIGDNTWQTIITEDGLIAVKKLLRMSATKNTAVACHWFRSRSRSDLLWVVGKRNKFNDRGIVPVNSTKKSLAQNKWENDWHYLPLIKALVAIAALLHDWGKASVLFQKKLNENNRHSKQGDPLRHEWVSCLLLNALVKCSGNIETDDSWLELLMQQNWDENLIKQTIAQSTEQANILYQLPPIAQLVAWLIVSHHRLPDLQSEDEKSGYKKYKDNKRHSIQDMLKSINATWGYQNKFDEDDYNTRLKLCFEFEYGLLSQSVLWNKQVKKWASRLLQESDNALACLASGSWRVVLHHARLCLMLGDHYYSSCDKSDSWQTSLPLIANTNKDGKPKQLLDEHLVHVCKHALQVSQSLSRLTEEMDSAYDINNLKKRGSPGYEWQDHAVKQIRQFKLQSDSHKTGCFVVNMASTGKGKTIANAKIMRALSTDGESLRYILALGLRTLTLQTGDSYRNDIGLGNDDLGVLIGSRAVQELHQKNNKTETEPSLTPEDYGSESLEELLNDELNYESMPQADFLDVLFSKNSTEKNKAFLYKPVLVCTIDHIMAATETKRGGKYILPSLRLLSSDLVIDEIDDFSGQDLVAIARLIHLVGMLGRKVMISSATIPPALAEGFFNAYYLGWQLYCKFKQLTNNDVLGMWVDEFKTQIEYISSKQQNEAATIYKSAHQKFVNSRVQQLLQQVVKHKAYIVKCDNLKVVNTKQNLDDGVQSKYFELIKTNIQQLHQHHHTIDIKTNKKVSFGIVRVANVAPCVALTRYLLNANWNDGIESRIMAYHSRQVLLLRSEQERHLDMVLKRKEQDGEEAIAFSDRIIRGHLDSVISDNMIFILVATPVEEVGRDHDFDWAVIEPSSYRSIIQLSGRVLRHRKITQDVLKPNIALMQYNLRGLMQADVAFTRPGFEMYSNHFKLETKDLELLIDTNTIINGISSIPRIQESSMLQATKKLADLEHAVTAHFLTKYDSKGPGYINGWLNEVWFLTALPQRFNQFRKSSPNIQLFAIMEEENMKFCERKEQGIYIPRSDFYQITQLKLNDLEQKRLWLNRNYYEILRDEAIKRINDFGDVNKSIVALSKRYGEIMLPEYDSDKKLMYSDQFGLVINKSEGKYL